MAAELPPRVLVGTVVHGTRLHAFDEWAAGLAGQRTNLRWDVLLAAPKPLVSEQLHRWVRDVPFGSYHRLRLRSPEDENEASRLIWGKFGGWVSYSSLLVLELDVWMPPHALQSLHEAGVAWASGAGPTDLPTAPLACALLSREAVLDPPSHLQPSYLPDVRWERIAARAAVDAAS